MNTDIFSSLPLSPACLRNLESLGYQRMTPIQAESLPAILAGHDVRARAKTGSGKTAAFGLGLLQGIDPQQFHPQALILCPTRELADQVSKELRRLARPVPNTKVTTLCGGTAMGPQFASLEHPPHVVVGTPGRILKHLGKAKLDLSQVKTVVLDEADRMLDMGFQEDILSIIGYTPAKRQTLLFSATYPDTIESISRRVQREPLNIEVESVHDEAVIQQIFHEVEKGGRVEALIRLLKWHRPESCVVFCGRKQQAAELAEALCVEGFVALALHGDLEQKDRDQVLVQFANGSVSVLVATDVAARGLDIDDLAMVLNYELSPDPEVYLHRIGRTGRAGREGLALSLFQPAEAPKVTAIERYLEQRLTIAALPTLEATGAALPPPAQVTLCINSGRKNKLRPGDILGALTGSGELQGSQVGRIDIFDFVAYVAVARADAKKALKILAQGRIKGRKMQVRRL